MASYTPNYNLKKPADADTYDIADANGNMDLIDTALHSQNEAIATESMGNLNSLSALQTALVTLNGTISNNKFRNITFGMNNADGLFASTVYSGTLIRFSSTRFRVEVGMGQHAYSDIIGSYNGGTWEWYSVDEAIASLNANNTSDRSGTISVANSTRTLLTTKTIPATGLYLIIRGIDWGINATGTRGLYKDMINAYRDSYVSQDAATALDTVQQMISLEEHAAGDSVYVCGIQSSGASLTAYPYIFFVKLR